MSEEKFPPSIPSQAAMEVVKAIAGGASDGLRGTVSDIWGGLIGDRIKQWRQRNLVGSLEKTAQFLRVKGVDMKDIHTLPDGAVYRIFEGSSKSEESGLQDLWAGLLANAMVNGSDGERLVTITNTLSQMSGSDAKLILLVVELNLQIDKYNSEGGRQAGKLSKFLKTKDEDTKSKRLKEFEESNRARLINFIESLKITISEAGFNDSALAEMSKNNLLRLGLIKAKTIPKLERRLWGSSIRGVNSHRLERELNSALSQIRNISEDFERWASSRLLAEEQPCFKVGNAQDTQVNYAISDYGKLFIEATEI